MLSDGGTDDGPIVLLASSTLTPWAHRNRLIVYDL